MKSLFPDTFPDIANPKRGANILIEKPRQRRQAGRVTLIVGAICKEGIVMAADSQVGYDGYVDRSIPKISTVRFKNGLEMAVGISGRVSTAYWTVKRLMRLASRFEPATEEAVVSAVCRCTQEARADIGRTAASELEKHDFSMLCGFYVEGRNHLVGTGLMPHSPEPYLKLAAIGIGNEIANHVLYGFDFSSMKLHEAAVLAIYAVEMGKKINPEFIGYETRLTTIPTIGADSKPPYGYQPNVINEAQEHIIKVARDVMELESQKETQWKAHIYQMVERLSDVFNQKTGPRTPHPNADPSNRNP